MSGASSQKGVLFPSVREKLRENPKSPSRNNKKSLNNNWLGQPGASGSGKGSGISLSPHDHVPVARWYALGSKVVLERRRTGTAPLLMVE
jgi:hypothetical protein